MNMKCKSCASCGMPLEKPEDCAMSNPAHDFCKYCTDERGSLLPFDKILTMNANYMVESQGVTSEAAIKMAKDLLKTQPAWKSAQV